MKPTSKKSDVCRARPLLGTFVEIKVSGKNRLFLQHAVTQAFSAVARVQALMSFHEPESDVSRLNREAYAHLVKVDPWTFVVLKAAQKLYRQTDGDFDISMAPVLENWGFLPLKDPKKNKPRIDASAIKLYKNNQVRFLQPHLRIDLGGIAKGFAVDRAVEVLQDLGITQGLVNAGGDVRAFGDQDWEVFVRHPKDPRRNFFPVNLRDEALANSGTYWSPAENSDKRKAPFVNPKTLKAAKRYRAVGVFAPTCMVADALTKILMIRGQRKTVPLLTALNASAYAI